MLTNLCAFLSDMDRKHWHISSYLYAYNHIHTAVLVEDTSCFAPSSEFIICRLTFFKIGFPEIRLTTEVSNHSFQINIRYIREFFEIEYQDDYKGFLDRFYDHFNRHTPPTVKEKLNDEEENVVIQYYQSQGENPYRNCYGVIHNRNNGQRRPCNDEKARRFAKEIYDYFCADTNISFCFHEGPASTLDEIVKRLSKQ